MDSRAIIRAVINLLLPVSCVGCGEPDTQWCPHCQATPTRHHQPTLAWREALWGIPVWAAVDHSGIWQRSIVSFKDRGAHRMSGPFGVLMAGLLERLALPAKQVVLLVPVPSSLGGWIARGTKPTLALAEATLRAVLTTPSTTPSTTPQYSMAQSALPRGRLAHFGGGFAVRQGLRRARGGVPLGQWLSPPHRRRRRTRSARLAQPSRFVARSWLRGHPVILIDDVLTTGVTLEHAAAAVQRAGGVVVGALVLSARSG